ERVEEWLGVFEDLEFEIEEIVDLGRGVVFAVVHQDARPIGSAAHVSTREAWVVVLERGMIVRRATFADIDEGRAAAERAVASRRFTTSATVWSTWPSGKTVALWARAHRSNSGR